VSDCAVLLSLRHVFLGDFSFPCLPPLSDNEKAVFIDWALFVCFGFFVFRRPCHLLFGSNFLFPFTVYRAATPSFPGFSLITVRKGPSSFPQLVERLPNRSVISFLSELPIPAGL